MDCEKTVVICIGSDRVAGDMLGPLVGSSLREEYKLPCPVYGAVGESVNGINLEEYVAMVKRRHVGWTIIAVDAALGREEDVGRIRLKRGGVKAGGALERKGEKIGDIGIVGVVAKERTPQEVYQTLLEVPYRMVEEMAAAIAETIAVVLAGKGAKGIA